MRAPADSWNARAVLMDGVRLAAAATALKSRSDRHLRMLEKAAVLCEPNLTDKQLAEILREIANVLDPG